MVTILIAIFALLGSIGVIGAFIFIWIDAIRERSIVLMFLAVILTLIILMPVGYIVDSYQKEVSSPQIVTVEVEVINKVYHPGTTRVIIINKIPTVIPVAPKYLTTISSAEYTHTFDNQSIYEALELGDKFPMHLVSYVDKSGKVFSKEFKFIE